MYQQIKAVRKYAGKTQKEFGEILGVSRDTLASYESGRVVPSNTFVQLLCATFDVNENWLRTGEGEMLIESDDVLLSQLSKKHDLDASSRKFIETYISLPQSVRDAIKLFALALVEDELNKFHREVLNELTHSDISEDAEESLYRRIKSARQEVFGVPVGESDLRRVRPPSASALAPEVTIDGTAVVDPEIASELSVIARELEQEKRATERSSVSPSAKDA